jgi:hypothetical protein
MYNDLKTTAPAILDDIKMQCMLRLGDASQLIRATVGLIITMIVQKGGLLDWPALIPALMQTTKSTHPHAVNVGLSHPGPDSSRSPSKLYCRQQE